jgi:hypothetical protein
MASVFCGSKKIIMSEYFLKAEPITKEYRASRLKIYQRRSKMATKKVLFHHTTHFTRRKFPWQNVKVIKCLRPLLKNSLTKYYKSWTYKMYIIFKYIHISSTYALIDCLHLLLQGHLKIQEENLKMLISVLKLLDWNLKNFTK